MGQGQGLENGKDRKDPRYVVEKFGDVFAVKDTLYTPARIVATRPNIPEAQRRANRLNGFTPDDGQ